MSDLLGRKNLQLVTITGGPGVGKTRLALEACARLGPAFNDEVYLVDLALVTDPVLVLPMIGHALGIRSGRNPTTQVLALALRDTDALLLLDNFEHLVAAAADVGKLLIACPRLKILATSRVPLKLTWEQELPLAPLPVPEVDRDLGADELLRNPAVALFMDRALAILPDFAERVGELTTVAQICRALDGLPLAIELAAARLRLFSTETILERLQAQPMEDLLSEHRPDVPPRHRGVADAVDWSYRLLDPEQQRVFRWMAVFQGGCTLDAARDICRSALGGADVLPAITALVDHSLLLRDLPAGGELRYRMLQPIRDYAARQLHAAEESAVAGELHAEWYYRYALSTAPLSKGPSQGRWLNDVEREMGNFRRAMRWLVQRGDGQRAMALTLALFRFWRVREGGREGIQWFQQARQLSDAAAPETRALGLAHHAALLKLHGQDGEGHEAAREACEISRLLPDKRIEAYALNSIGLFEGPDEMGARFQQALSLCRTLHDPSLTSRTLNNVGTVAHQTGDNEAARLLWEEAVATAREHGDLSRVLMPLLNLVLLATDRRDLRTAGALLREGLVRAVELGSPEFVARGLGCAAYFADVSGNAAAAGRLFGAAEALYRRTGVTVLDEWDRRTIAHIRSTLTAAAASEAWAEGRKMAVPDAVAEALAVASEGTRARAARGRLSGREREVADLVAQGRSNRAIAQALFIGERTVESHVQSILNKLGFHSRSQIAAWVSKRSSP